MLPKVRYSDGDRKAGGDGEDHFDKITGTEGEGRGTGMKIEDQKSKTEDQNPKPEARSPKPETRNKYPTLRKRFGGQSK